MHHANIRRGSTDSDEDAGTLIDNTAMSARVTVKSIYDISILFSVSRRLSYFWYCIAFVNESFCLGLGFLD
jgi:hypothetical protein